MMAANMDELVARICEQQATESDWIEFAALARSEPRLWGVLARTQQQQAGLARAVERVGELAESVPLPPERQVPASSRRGAANSDPLISVVAGRIRSWSGWAVAAALLLAFIVQWGFRSGAASSSSRTDQEGTALVPAGQDSPTRLVGDDPTVLNESMRALLDRGRDGGLLLGEIPERVLIDARPAADGRGYELLYLRQFLEQSIVPDLYVPAGQDEEGKPTLVRYERGPGNSM